MQAPPNPALPPKYVSPSSTWKTKLSLRAVDIVCLIILAGVSGSLATTNRVNLLYEMVILAPAMIVTFIWNIAEIICIRARGGNRGIHPGAVVAIDLIAWLGWAFILVLFSASGIARRPRYLIEDYSGYYRYHYDEDRVTDEDRKLEDEISGKGRAILAFLALVVIIHFVVFVIACIETNIRNRMPRTVYVMQPVYGGPVPPPNMIPGAYHQLQSFPPGATPAQPAPGQQGQPGFFVQPANGAQMPTQPAPVAQAGDTKGGAERFA